MQDQLLLHHHYRQVDSKATTIHGWEGGLNGHHGSAGYSNTCNACGGECLMVYTHPIPIDVLRKTQKIIKAFKEDTLHFYVSDYISPKPDPFVLCTTPFGNTYVFAFWDEPGFDNDEND